MKKLIENKSFVLASIAILIIVGLYIASIMDEPRMADGALEFDEASTIEIIFIMLAPISGITMWILATFHAFGSGKKLWGIMNFIAWPVAFVYALLLNYKWLR
ncbi:MAG: hypothetical protein OEW89_11745 [Gammaproteobacteria bacterium]|nr:hypothetical protein [Gammaproteobacteria bacterium]